MSELGGPDANLDDAERYLTRVSGRLRMPPAAERDVIDELRAHIADAADALEQEGLSRDAAERRALARLGAAEALGEELRRSHQSRRRLLAAAGGGVWDGLNEGLSGLIVGSLLGGMALMLLAEIVAQVFGDTMGSVTFSPSFSTTYGAVAMWVGAWWGARGLVHAISRRSARTVASVRMPIALIGAAAVGLLVALWKTDHSWASVIGLLAVPVMFAIAAGTARQGDGATRDRWYRRRPSGRVVPAVVLVPFLLSLMTFAVLRPAIDIGFGDTCCDIEPPPGLNEEPPPLPPDDVAWGAAGYLAVAPSVLDFHRHHWDASRPSDDGRVFVTLGNDWVDWDEWDDLRVEAWQSLPERSSESTLLLPGEIEPYIVVPLEPWADPGAVVPVGSVPGVSRYLLFVTAIDPATGDRVALGHPDGDDTAFYGNILDWFAALGA